ncbi:MAG TPA: hypothetical protein VFC09_02635 [Candidatus Dormibacteraeota bacterium]|nr:hypothetical protein [Candidatus Dormibacteraeota bacterium]
MRRRPKPVVVPMRPVPEAYSGHRARCPGCGEEGAEVVGVIALRLVFRCGQCGVKFHRTDRWLAVANHL